MSTDPSPDDPTLLSSGPPSGGGGEPGAPLAGDGRYELLKELAHGGMGVVYAARDPRFGREVAVKTLHARLRDRPDVVTRFVAEARFTGRLQHPGIPPVHELGTLPDGRPYLAMKLVSGRTLARWLAERTDPADDRGRLLAAFGQVCQAVGYAHEQGLIHRDLKPSNVMVGAFGEVQVMDWGIAKDTRSTEEVPVPAGSPADPDRSADPEATLTAPPSRPAADSRTPVETAAGTILGTPQYMAPEQARGEPVGSRADVFGLGAILCEILTGRPPFSGASSLDCVLRAATGDLGAAWERLAGCGADPELVA
ncbi:MAG: serine/threonine protein kinase, partial [Planctomycetes bacterium]|nr:serine/threonine protein kinase [Planctomycetota bacterium]